MAGRHLMSWLRLLVLSSQPVSLRLSKPSAFFLNESSPCLLLSSLLLLVACDQDQNKTQPFTKDLIVPERTLPVYMTDQLVIAGQELSIWSDHERCQLKSSKRKTKPQEFLLKPPAPCYFIKSPSSNTVQIYQRDKTSRVLAIVGTPDLQMPPAKRCGIEVQGLVLDAMGAVHLSNLTSNSGTVCADQGLTNTQYELFAKD
ncbi:MAG TPA: hypothetical protein PLM98_00070 [Thiolinea sp.]|nr:hypothetical protein [Thiolinea sp.]